MHRLPRARAHVVRTERPGEVWKGAPNLYTFFWWGASFGSGTHTRNVWGRRERYRPGDTIMVLNAGAGVPFTVVLWWICLL